MATTMTKSGFLTDESVTKFNMWGGIRCTKGLLIVILIHVIVVQYFIYRQERSIWRELANKTDSIIIEALDLYGSLNERINGIKCAEDHGAASGNVTDIYERPMIYAITPTFARPVQKAELTRLHQTFLHITNFHWIVVEDAAAKTKLVTRFLENSGMIYTHLAAATPPSYKLGRNDPNWKKPRGVEQRNAALRWLRENRDIINKGIVFFADDDNTYSIKLFREMEKIKKVGVWPVGLVGGLMVEKPICHYATKKVVGFNAAWKPDRPFPLDMAGFGINLRLLLEHKEAMFSYDVEGGYQESEILRQIVKRDELEPLADCCTKVYVWHTRTEPPQLNVEQLLIKKGVPSNLGIEV